MSQVVLASVLPIPYPGAFYKSIIRQVCQFSLVDLLRTSLCREGTRRHGLLAQKDGRWMGAIVWEVD